MSKEHFESQPYVGIGPRYNVRKSKSKALAKKKIDKFGGGTGGGFREGQCVNCDKHTKGGKCPSCNK